MGDLKMTLTTSVLLAVCFIISGWFDGSGPDDFDGFA